MERDGTNVTHSDRCDHYNNPLPGGHCEGCTQLPPLSTVPAGQKHPDTHTSGHGGGLSLLAHVSGHSLPHCEYT